MKRLLSATIIALAASGRAEAGELIKMDHRHDRSRWQIRFRCLKEK